MSKSKPKHHKAQSSVIPQIERLLTEQTSVILQAVDEKLSAQDKRIEQGFAAHDKQIEQGFAAQDKRMEERFVAQEIRILAAMDKRLEKVKPCSSPLRTDLMLGYLIRLLTHMPT